MKRIWLLCIPLVLAACNNDDDDNDAGTTQPIDNGGVVTDVFSVDPSSNTEAFVSIMSRTTCGACGQHGHPNFDDVVHMGSDINAIAVHYSSSDDLAIDEGLEFVQVMNLQFTPTFTSGLMNLGNSRSDLENAVSQIQGMQPEITIGMEGEIAGSDEFTIRMNLSEYSGSDNLSLALYVVENNVITGQSDYSASPSWVEDYVHNHVLRQVPLGLWGQTLTEDLTDGETVESTFQITAEMDPDNVWFVAVVYAVDGQGKPSKVLNSQTLKRD